MASYQVYIPGPYNADQQYLASVGLGDIIDPNLGATAEHVLQNGPDGKSGMLFYWDDPERPESSPRLGIHLDEQEWTPAKASGPLKAGRYWLGREKGNPVTPYDLMRKEHYGGGLVKLDDGYEWCVPIAQRLPCRLTLDEDGRPIKRVKRPYEDYYAKVVGFYRTILCLKDDPNAEFVLEGAWPFAVQALNMNYRVNAEIIDWLELLDELNIQALIAATFEMSAMMEIAAQKKTA